MEVLYIDSPSPGLEITKSSTGEPLGKPMGGAGVHVYHAMDPGEGTSLYKLMFVGICGAKGYGF